MQRIGIAQLKARVSEILRNVRHAQTSYIITYRGQPVAQLTPLDETQPPSALSAKENWEELTRLGQQISDGWPAGLNSTDILSEMRR